MALDVERLESLAGVDPNRLAAGRPENIGLAAADRQHEVGDAGKLSV